MIDITQANFTKFYFWREIILSIMLIMITYICYVVLVLPVSQMNTMVSGLPFLNVQSTNALSYVMVAFGAAFVLLALGLLAWGVGSIFRRGEDTARL